MSEINKSKDKRIKVPLLFCVPIILLPPVGMIVGTCDNDVEKCNHPHNVEHTGYPNPNQSDTTSTTVATSTGPQGPQGGVSGYSGGYGGSPYGDSSFGS